MSGQTVTMINSSRIFEKAKTGKLKVDGTRLVKLQAQLSLFNKLQAVLYFLHKKPQTKLTSDEHSHL